MFVHTLHGFAFSNNNRVGQLLQVVDRVKKSLIQMLFAEKICRLALENIPSTRAEYVPSVSTVLCSYEVVRGFIIFNPTELLNDFCIVYFGMGDRSEQAKT